MNWSVVDKRLNYLLIILIFCYIAYYIYKLPKYDSGEMAQNFKSVLKNGESFQLYDLKGHYVLLDFWGSWCGPCRQENKALVSLYRETQNAVYEGGHKFYIVSIGLESKRESWEKAIIQDQLEWPHHIGCFDRFSSPEAKLYGVKEIPTKYFIDAKGHIVMVNPKVEEVAAYLEKKKI